MAHIITIDGGTATGTTSNAKRVADKLNCARLNSGQLYRCLTALTIAEGIKIDLANGIVEADLKRVIALAADITFSFKDGSVHEMNGLEVNHDHLEAMGQYTPHVAHIPGVRDHIRVIQRDFADEHEFVVAEGRDLGTIVFPDADRKIFLQATLESRAQRCGNTSDRVITIDQMRDRDRLDSERDHSPLIPSPEAIIFDTSTQPISQISGQIINSMRGVPAFEARIAEYDLWRSSQPA